MERRIAARDVRFHLTDDLKQPVNTEAVLVRDVLETFDRRLPAHIQRLYGVGGGWFRSLVFGDPAKDFDAIAFVRTDLSLEQVEREVQTAMDATLQEVLQQARLKKRKGDAPEVLARKPVKCVIYRKGHPKAPILSVVSGIPGQHFDLRVVFGDGPGWYFDFLKNAGVATYASILDLKKPLELCAPKGFTVDEVLYDITHNMIRSTHDLTDDSIYRVWTELWKGNFPAAGQAQWDAPLHDVYWAYLRARAKSDAEEYGDHAFWLPRHLAESIDRIGHTKGVGALASAIVHLQSYTPNEDRENLLTVVRRSLQAKVGTQAADPLSQGILTLLHSDATTQTLSLWFHLLTCLREPPLPVERDAIGAGWMRARMPVLNGYLTVPPLAADCKVEAEIVRALHTIQQNPHVYAAPFALIAQLYAEQTFEGDLATLTNSASPDERQAAWARCQETLQHSGPAARSALTASLAKSLPQLVASMRAEDYDACAAVLKYLVGDLGDDAVKSCFLLKSALLQARRPHEALQSEVNRLLAGFGDSPDRPHLQAVLQRVKEEAWSKAWALLGTEEAAWDAVPGAVAAALLDHVNFKLLSGNVSLALALLQRAAITGSSLDAFWSEKRRMKALMTDVNSLHAMGKLIDATSVPANSVKHWQTALQANPAALAHVLAETGPHHRTFWVAAYARMEQTQTRAEHVEVLQDVWTRHRQGGAPDSDTVVSFVVEALSAYRKLPYVAGDFSVDVSTLRQWAALLERCDEALREDAPLVLVSALHENGAFAEAVNILVGESRRCSNRPNASGVFSQLALDVLDGLLPPGATTVDAELLPLAEKLIRAMPDDSVGHDRRWQEAHGRLFMHFLDHEQNDAAEKVRRRMHARVAHPETAENVVGAMYNAGTDEQRQRWDNHNDTHALRNDLHAMRLLEQMLPSDPEVLYSWVAGRQNAHYQGAEQRIDRALEKSFTGTGASEAMEVFRECVEEAYNAQLPESMFEELLNLRRAMEPHFRAYLAASPADERAERLAQIYQWVGADFDAPLPLPATFDRQALQMRDATLHTLVSLAHTAFALDKAKALPRFQRLVEQLLTTPAGAAKLFMLMSNLGDVIENPVLRAVTIIKNAVRETRKTSWPAAYDMAVQGLIFAHSYVLPRNPDLATYLTLELFEEDAEYRRDAQAALWTLAFGIVRTLERNVPLPQRNRNLFQRLEKIERSERETACLVINSGPGGQFSLTIMQEDLAMHMQDLLRSRNRQDLYHGMRLLFDTEVFAMLPRGPGSVLVEPLRRALVMSDHRQALLKMAMAWSDKLGPRNTAQALEIMQMIVEAQCGTYTLHGLEVAGYLEVLCARRTASPIEDEWNPLMQKVVAAAQRGCFRADVWVDAARLQWIKDSVALGEDSDAMAGVLLGLDRLS